MENNYIVCKILIQYRKTVHTRPRQPTTTGELALAGDLLLFARPSSRLRDNKICRSINTQFPYLLFLLQCSASREPIVSIWRWVMTAMAVDDGHNLQMPPKRQTRRDWSHPIVEKEALIQNSYNILFPPPPPPSAL